MTVKSVLPFFFEQRYGVTHASAYAAAQDDAKAHAKKLPSFAEAISGSPCEEISENAVVGLDQAAALLREHHSADGKSFTPADLKKMLSGHWLMENIEDFLSKWPAELANKEFSFSDFHQAAKWLHNRAKDFFGSIAEGSGFNRYAAETCGLVRPGLYGHPDTTH